MQRKKKKNKKLILDATEKLISAKGLVNITMEEVAQEADLATGTLYLYFKNKESLFAAINARFNKDMNQAIKKKMDLYETGSEKVVATGTAIVEFCLANPQKWKVGTELHQMPFEDVEDLNVQEFFHTANDMIHMLADAYRQGMEEGSIHADLDPVSTAIFSRMAFINSFTLTSEQKMLLQLNEIDREHYLSVSWNLINRSTHVKPSLREEGDIPLEYHRSEEEIGREIKTMVDSLGLPADDAVQIRDAWKMVAQITMGKGEYDFVETTKSRCVVHVNFCPITTSYEKTKRPVDNNMIEGCKRFGKILVETLNPKYTQRFTKQLCAGDDYCECIIELKED
ncbi:MAG: transcriptional regulator BetI [Methanobacterium sp. PtaB.Bin024]|nr:MAG: transcriptional regulator BetI [Methanobacterium sp. PtaB.Bin024]